MSARREEGGQPKTDSCGQGRREGISQMWMSALKEKWFSFFLIIIFWKYFLSNINLIFEYRVPDKIMLDCKVYSSSLHIHTHTRLLHILSAYHRSKNYFLICQPIFICWVVSLNELHRISPWFVVCQFIEITLLL